MSRASGSLPVSAETVVTLVLLVGVGALLLGNALGQPILLGFVETDSMSPTLEAGDGFVAVPSFLTGEPEVGDIVVYEAEEVQGGGLTTHRIVGEGDEGYVTKGDANPFTDQDGGEPPVTQDRIVAEVLRVGGSTLVLPKLGVGIEKARGAVVYLLRVLGVGPDESGAGAAGPVLLGAGFFLILMSFLDERRASSRNRHRSTSVEAVDARLFLVIMLIAVLAPANAAMLGPAQTHEIAGPEQADVDTESGKLTADVTAHNEGLVAMLVVLESADGDSTIDETELELSSGGSKTATVVPEPGTEGPYTVSEYRYFMLLPSSVLLSLHYGSPVLALGVINLLLAVGVFGLVVGLVGTGRVRARETKGGVPLATRLRRRLR